MPLRNLPARLLLLASALACGAAGSAPADAQASGQAGLHAGVEAGLTVRGSISDSAGSAVSGVEVRLLHDGQPAGRALTSSTGQFKLVGIPPGAYHLLIPAFHGLAAQDRAIAVSAALPPVAIVLAPAAVEQTVTVSGAQTLSTAAADNRNSVTLSGEALNHLPVFDQDPISTLTSFLDPGDIASGGVSILVDGIELKGLTVTPSAIAEMRINRDPYSAEYASPGRGRIEITTKPGAPEYHGTFNFIFRDATFNGRNFFAPVRPPEQRRIYEGNLTGPIGHGGHTNFLVSGTERDEDLQVAVHATGPPGELGFDSAGNLAENVATPSRKLQMDGHLDHDFSDAHRISIGYNFYHHPRLNEGVGGLVLPEAGTHNDYREDDLILNDRLILTPNLIQQLGIVAEKDEGIVKSNIDAPALQVDGSFVAGGAQNDFSHTENTIHVAEIVGWTHQRH